jgi:hypothetical protein
MDEREYSDDLPIHLRPRNGRGCRGDWREGSRCTGKLAVQHRCGQAMGREFLWVRHTAHSEGSSARRDGNESRPGGIFWQLLRLVRLGLGGAAGRGNQYVSWIHELDFERAVDYLIAHEEIESAVNITAPVPLPHASAWRSLGNPLWPSCVRVDAGRGYFRSPHGVGIAIEKPARCPSKTLGAWLSI